MPEKSLRVLLIESDVADREAVRRLLRSNYLLSEALTGIQGVEAATSTRPNCVLLSTWLPDGDALEVLEQLVGGRRIVPVVVLASAAEDDVADRAVAAGALGVVYKNSLTAGSLRSAVEIAVRSAALRRDLESSRRELKYLTSSLAREFRGPLHRIVRMSHDVRGRLASHLDEQSSTDLVFIKDRALGMATIVDELVEYSQAGAGDEPLGWVDMNEVIRQVLVQLDDAIQRNQARVEVEPLPMVWGDTYALVRLVKNLLTNSIKFHGRGTPVVLIGSRLKEDDWEISVQDNGIGIEPQRQSQIFRPFKQGHSTGQDGGRGLGLAACARIVERHGGRIRVFSNPGQGSIFRFTLKVPPLQGVETATSPAEKP